MKLALAAVLSFVSATPAMACTICHSATALSVRHQVLEHDFGANAAALAAPIPILLAAILLMAREPRSPRSGDDDSAT